MVMLVQQGRPRLLSRGRNMFSKDHLVGMRSAQRMLSAAIPRLKPHHFSVSVPDIEAAIAWYGNILGFVLESRFEVPPIAAQGAFLKRDALRLELWQIGPGAQVPAVRKNPDSDLTVGGTKHMAFAVPDLQAHLPELVRRGVDIAAVQRDPTQPMKIEANPAEIAHPAAFAVFIRDPGGTLIELLDEGALGAMNLA
jgi:methylmalonyl-CoA/ethylmalonyl-CoA epimerase